MVSEIKISIIIPCYQSEAHIRRTLEHIHAQSSSPSFEVIVVDSSPTDAVERIAKTFPEVRFEKLEKKTPPGIARNIGAALAQGELLNFLDDDVFLCEDALSRAWSEYKENNKVIFGGALESDPEDLSWCGKVQHSFFYHESLWNKPPSTRSNLSSGILYCQRKLFLDSGGFKDIPRMQDTELTERLVREGQTLYFCPSVKGYCIQDSSWKLFIRKVFINGNNVFLIRNDGNIPPFKKVALFFLLPLIASAKTLRILFRLFKYSTMSAMEFLVMTPMMFFLGGVWMFGAYKTIVFGGGISNQR